MQNTIGALLSHAAQRYGDKAAVIYESSAWSFTQLDNLSNLIAQSLIDRGVQPGDVVSLYSPNSPEWVFVYYGILKAGAVINPLNLMLTPEEAAFAIADCGAVAVFGTSDRIKGLQSSASTTCLRHYIQLDGQALPGALSLVTLLKATSTTTEFPLAGISSDDVSTIGYTSGTTGHPKGAVLTHQSILMNVAMTATMHGRNQMDVVVSALPLSHVYGNVVMNAAIGYGMTLVLHRTFEAGAILESMQANRATIFEGVPTMYLYLLDHPRLKDFDLSTLSRCTVGGQTMPEAKMEEVERVFGCRLLELWGMTELGGLGATHSVHGPRRLGAIGIPLPHQQARIVDPVSDKCVSEPGEVGELQMRGSIVMREYLGRPDATREAKDEKGWLRTGDLAYIDANGFIFVVDRLKDLIITAGFNIYPAELERVIAEHPGVSMVAVGSVPDVAKGELAKAYIVKRADVDLDLVEVEKHCRQRLAAYKVPRFFTIVDDLPKTASGKVMRRKLREIFD
ncbi:acyl-CoA synthase [Pseudomonas sp. 02C 26]|uniref:class I adenylate-forming enzyme family protein n=1 Tax=Pseudomonas sp. 02C 26 TaxID=2054914 RepID=UPI000C6E3AF7|nr:class I adenylate-forming enzyme family protein [Pseudomonas sp. 02C 26]AUF96838.1 acyl-CoA synthase [Pseudomonas sp. 02C 26]